LKRDDTNLELDAILRRATAQSPGPTTPECADPEMLAAYYDRSLAEPDRGRLEEHFADCARCQAQLAAIARADEAGVAARPNRRVSWLRPLIVVPALAAAAALLVVVRSMRTSNDHSLRSEQIAMAKRQAPLTDLTARAPAPVSPPAPSSPAANEIAMNEAKPAEPSVTHRMTEHRRAPARRDEPRERAMPLAKKPHLQEYGGEVIASAPSSRSSGDLASTQAAPATGPTPVSASAQAGAVSAPVQAGSPETSAAQSSQPPPAAPAPYAMSETATAPRALAKSVSSFAASNSSAGEVISTAPVGGAATGAGASAAIGASVGAAQLHLEQATSPSAKAAIGSGTGAIAGSALPSGATAPEVVAMISSPEQKAAWIVGRNGMIVRRYPDGRTHPQQSGVTTDLTAGAAPSATVCWIVGRSGTIIRTTDGEHWELVAAPTGDNLVAVTSQSADHATVTTASGQNFATTDGGSSWHRQ
jgi:hypothetical protein